MRLGAVGNDGHDVYHTCLERPRQLPRCHDYSAAVSPSSNSFRPQQARSEYVAFIDLGQELLSREVQLRTA